MAAPVATLSLADDGVVPWVRALPGQNLRSRVGVGWRPTVKTPGRSRINKRCTLSKAKLAGIPTGEAGEALPTENGGRTGFRMHMSAGSALWLTLATGGGAYAQTAPTDPGEASKPLSAAQPSEQEIVVTGIRGGIEQAVRIKRNAPSIVDVISTDDIGRYRDVNVAESVQRISGVQINRTRGEGRSVHIRGLPDTFTLVTLNGRAVPNAINDLFTGFSRSFDFPTLPPEFVRTLEVYKSPTPDLEDGGLSGTANIRTPRALDLGHRIVTVAAQAEYESNSGKAAPRVSVLFADRFLDNQLGITIGASYTHPTKAIDVSATAFPEARHRNDFSDPFLGWHPASDARTQSRNADSSVASVHRGVMMVKKKVDMAFDDGTEI